MSAQVPASGHDDLVLALAFGLVHGRISTGIKVVQGLIVSFEVGQALADGYAIAFAIAAKA